MTAKTNAERVAAYRARKREQGLPEVRGIYAPKELHAKIKEEAKKITKRP
jgi:hypothetical protein